MYLGSIEKTTPSGLKATIGVGDCRQLPAKGRELWKR